MRWALIACALVACSSDTGIAFEISTPPATRFVELFVAPAECTVLDAQGQPQPCADGVGWHPSFPVVAGKVFALDDPRAEDGLITLAAVDGDRAVIRLQAPEPTTLSRVVLVGYTDHPSVAPESANSVAVLHHLEIPIDRGERWSIALAAASTIPDDPRVAAATSPSVRVWRRPGGTVEAPAAACLAIQHTTSSGPEREFLVPSEDPDCDAVLHECQPYVANATSSSTDLNCPLRHEANASASCRLGNVQCTDGVAGGEACMPPAAGGVTCVPDALCDAGGCAAFDADCLQRLLAPESYTGPFFKCTLPFDSTADGANQCVGNGPWDRLFLDTSPVLGNRTCTGIGFGPPAVPVQFNAAGTFATEAGVTWTSINTGGCNYEIKPTGRHDPLAPPGQVSTVLASFQLGQETQLVVPIFFNWVAVPDCLANVTADVFGCTPTGFDATVSPFTCAAI